MKKILTYAKDGRWRKQIEGRVYYFGRGKSKTDSRSYAAAEKKYFEFLVDREKSKGIVKRVSSLTMKEFGEKFLQYSFSRYEGNEISASRFEKLKTTVAGFVAFMGPKHALASLCEMDLEDYRIYLLSLPVSSCTGRPISVWTAKSYLDILKQFIKWGYKVALIDQLPRNLDGYSRVNLPQPTIKRFSREEINLIYDSADQRMKIFIVLALNCGFGQSDISNLRVGEIDIKEGRIIRKRSKTGVDCQFALWPLTVKLLKDHGNMGGASGDSVFVSRSGQPLVHERYVNDVLKKTDSIRFAFTRLMKKLDIPQDRGFYAIRKTAACEIERIDPMVTEMYLGHSERGLKKHYAERHWDRLDVALLELESRFDLESKE